MSEISLPMPDDEAKKKGGLVPTVIAVVVLTLVAGGGGAGLGMMLGGSTPPAPIEVKPTEVTPAEEAAKAGEADIADAEKSKLPLRLIPLQPVLTNIYSPPSTWLRIEASIVIQDDGSVDDGVLAAEIEADTMTFLRTVQLAQIEGSRGLLHLRDDLRERAKLRSPTVVDYLIRTMVAE
ncbi:flagellar basal body-associated FliL family protein [Aurantimonas sp. VKM B-3413]|uniref:flagellar basal body-associated FliL family protein n=1 Tax=Aurantimonas sp. VKM B-3413 TaxID=2779401 RepID=UPI001E62CAEF|nr:flagellar basal body-associated FliL family protein [Aurantimonas sp. VKM B-3413]MCB8837922.1 flagellar basal body-associated FliL family protein [Aurantimonas sp. VKM B-3413]